MHYKQPNLKLGLEDEINVTSDPETNENTNIGTIPNGID